MKLVRIYALIIKFKNILIARINKEAEFQTSSKENWLIETEQIEEAKYDIIKIVQQKCFREEYCLLNSKDYDPFNNNRKIRRSKIFNLDPFLDENGIIQVGGRLNNSTMDECCKHPLLLPKGERITSLIIRHHHAITGHGGRRITLNEIRSSGYWIVGANTEVKRIIFNCITCRKLRGKVGEQKMANLPFFRSNEAPPFTYCGVDMFGPFVIKQRRSELKRFGAMFTCLASRAVHIEVTCTMNTDSFILALRRLMARRGNIRVLYSDNGSNFLGVQKELKKAFVEMNSEKIQPFLLEY